MNPIAQESMKLARLALREINLLRAKPTAGEKLAAWLIIIILIAVFVAVAPFSTYQWHSTHIFYAAAGIASFAEITTGILLLSQVNLLRHDAGFVLSLGYLLGGCIILLNLILVNDTDTRLWMFRLWHGVFVLSVLIYALLNVYPGHLFRRESFLMRRRLVLVASVAFIGLLIIYLLYHPFSLPVIIHGNDYMTSVDFWVNAIQLLVILVAFVFLQVSSHKTALSVWMSVVSCAVAIDIALFVLGGKLFSVGLYISKLNNLIAATLIFGVMFYRLIRVQNELIRHRVRLLRNNRHLARAAMTDALTGLPNRAALDFRLDQALNRASQKNSLLAVCVIDLDDFKPINDNYGHEMGDALLVALASRLSGLVREGEFVTRLGGDEFVMILENLEGQLALDAVISRLKALFDSPFHLMGIEIKIRASIGSAVYPYTKDGKALLREADQALYRSKAMKEIVAS